MPKSNKKKRKEHKGNRTSSDQVSGIRDEHAIARSSDEAIVSKKNRKVKPSWPNTARACWIIVGAGIVVFWSGLTSPFLGDDFDQIVDNIPVHSLANIRLFFEGGTFYNGHGLAPLSGAYYRPLMTTVFSLLYSAFGPHPVFFHLLQFAICIGGSIFLFLFLRYFISPKLALLLSLVFLVHPLNSQVAFAIASMQDALYFFFGILGMWLLVRSSARRNLVLVALCFFLSLLAKETGALFVVMAFCYLLWSDRARVLPYVGAMSLPVIVWLILKIHAVGLFAVSSAAPIAHMSLAERVMTVPSILALYGTKLIIPMHLASGYYWVQNSFSVQNVLAPLLADILILSALAFIAVALKKRGSMIEFRAYIFFAIWSALGLLIHMQIFPLDFTVAEPWFYFTMAGLLGMIGVALNALATRNASSEKLIFKILIVLIVGFSVRTAIRGVDWHSQYALAMNDISVTKDNYNAYNNVASSLMSQGRYKEAESYATESVKLNAYYTNNYNLGLIRSHLGNYSGAAAAYTQSLKYGDYISAIHGLGELTLVSGSYATNRSFLVDALRRFPQDPLLWAYLAVLYQQNHDNRNAVEAITNARKLGSAPRTVYNGILNNQPFSVPFPDLGTTINVQ